ncbi:MAG: phytanoyl-CoA dioxygenase family protein [Proteobacteria bacterium]|nr:phytanoyl-CoA dioxygenase family protein [Pseudomonadota bacterium]MDA1301110.1 phytanoyl-CoA dioxygenase family protein [Pseudomonadota bacterium]
MSAPSDQEVADFLRDGYLVRRRMAAPDVLADLNKVASQHLEEQLAPAEYEIDVHYPGAPVGPNDAGAGTVRRLLGACSRHPLLRQWATSAQVCEVLQTLFDVPLDEGIMLSQCHHNCIMTKQPGFSSVTRWHQDNRYWSFDQEDLISVWLALGREDRSNGCLRVIPGSHVMGLAPGRFDAALFLRTDIPENKALAGQGKTVELDPGDTLFFHSRLLHAAGRNLTDEVKYSLVFTYHRAGNRPIADTRSARFPSIDITTR